MVFAGGSCKIPYIQQLLGKEFPSSEIHLSPPPDEAIATGCALQAAVMGGRWEGGRAGGGEEDWGRVEMKCVPQDLWIMVSLSHRSGPLPDCWVLFDVVKGM